MLALPYKNNESLYNNYDLYLKQTYQQVKQSAKGKTKPNYEDLLQLDKSKLLFNNPVGQANSKQGVSIFELSNDVTMKLHSYLSKMANRHGGSLRMPQTIAKAINYGNIAPIKSKAEILQEELKLELKKAKFMKRGKTSATKMSSVVQKKIDSDLKTEERNQAPSDGIDINGVYALDSDEIDEFNALIKFRNDVALQMIIPFINVNCTDFDVLIPNYMKQLMASGIVYNVEIIDTNTYHSLKMFEDLQSITSIERTRLPLSKKKLYLNQTGLSDLFVQKALGIDKTRMMSGLGSILIFKYGKLIFTYRSNVRYIYWKSYVGKTFKELYILMMKYVYAYNSEFINLNSDAVLINVIQGGVKPADLVLGNVLIKFYNQCVDKTDKKVIFVMQGNKGSGKSTLMKEFKSYLEARFNEKVGYISSDLPSRWWKKYGISVGDEQLSSLCEYDDMVTLDSLDDHDGWLEEVMTALITKHKIRTVNDALLLQKSQAMYDEFRDIYYLRLNRKSLANEGLLYDKISSSISSPRIMLFDEHVPVQDAMMPRGNVTLALISLWNPLSALMLRPNPLVQVCLYQAFNQLSSRNHTKCRGVDLFAM